MPKIVARDTQKILTVITNITLNPFTNSIDVLILSGFGGITTNAIPINIA